MRYQTFSQNRWLFPDTEISGPLRPVSLALLRGNSGGFQLLVRDLCPEAPITWSAQDMDGVQVQAFREKEVRVNRNTNAYQSGKLTTDRWEDIAGDRVRQAPYRVFDPLEELEGQTVTGETEAFYFTFRPTADGAPGVRNALLHITFGKETLSLPIRLEVWDGDLPAESLWLTNWFSVSNMARDHHLPPGTPEHRDMIRKYAASMRECHQNIFRITWEELGATREGGTVRFDFSKIKQRVHLFLEYGFSRIEWAPVIFRPTWEEPPFQIADRTAGNTPLECLSTRGRKYLTAFLEQFNGFLTENGWQDISLVHISDEPKERCAADFRALAGIFRKYLPGVKLIDAVEIYFIQDALDIYVPKNHYYQLNRNDFEDLRDARNELWFYTCNMPGGHYLNRFLDSPLLNTRLLHWGNYKYHLTGYLHWGYNQTRDGQDPFEETSASEGLPAGDCNIVYPGPHGPLRSLRYEQMKAGVEDYELLRALSQTDRTVADRLCRQAFRSFDDYITDPETFDRLHDELVREVAKKIKKD